MTESWHEYALDLRKLLGEIGADVPSCLPGEPEDCGSDYAHHCMGYLALLKAKIDQALWHMHHGAPGGLKMADRLCEHWRAQVAAEADCGQCKPFEA